MSEMMVARVARAIRKCAREIEATHEYFELPDEVGDVFARAAIEAMREPTEEMVFRGGVYVYGYEDMRSARECWRAMIAAALAGDEKKEG